MIMCQISVMSATNLMEIVALGLSAYANLKIVFLTVVGFNVDFAEDKVISMAGSTKPTVNILLSGSFVLLDAR
ncbi:hypothetical protein DKX38_006510 [Salix brachista]|uniref:Uncharacterized protein n=1 Tax=Salix brachista TaxID=2182728 RepID=A0A5N5N4I6_9ROSI|nr:hypothetical protein DKX38_006510 [Salix brachista]